MAKIGFLTDDPVLKEKARIRAELMAERKKHKIRQKQYSDTAKIEAVKTFLALGGNSSLTAASLGISNTTIIAWRNTNWWNQLINEIRKQEKIELSAKTKNIIDKSLDLVMDRLEHGDFMYDQKQGVLVRKPIPARELNKIAVNMIEQKNILDKATEEQVQTTTNEEKLAKLAERFA